MGFSEAEHSAGGFENENILADGMEALIGAIYLDAGLEVCRNFVEELWGNAFYDMAKPPQHPKTALQEWAQGNGLPLPTYKIIGQSGPDHAPVFDVQLHVKGHDDLIAQGKSRQIAEREAARLFLKQLESKSK